MEKLPITSKRIPNGRYKCPSCRVMELFVFLFLPRYENGEVALATFSYKKNYVKFISLNEARMQLNAVENLLFIRFTDFSEAHIDSKNPKKMHCHLW